MDNEDSISQTGHFDEKGSIEPLLEIFNDLTDLVNSDSPFGKVKEGLLMVRGRLTAKREDQY
jgi:hypothetical protein